MNRWRRLARFTPLFGVALLALAFVAPHLASAATGTISPGFRIVPDVCNCAAGAGWGCVLQVVQNLFQFVIFLGILFCMFGVVYAAAVWILSPINAGNREKGRQIFTNAVIGLVIVLAAYLLVNTLLNFLTGKTVNGITAVFGTASANCLPTATDQVGTVSGSTTGFAPSSGSTSVPPLQNGVGSCNATQVQSAAAAGGYSISTAEAETLACLAGPESTCGQHTTGATQSNGTPTSAAGPWQNLLGASDKCHSLNIPACGNLNCSAAYSGGKVKQDAASQSLAAQCQAEVNNLTCAASAAACLAAAGGGYTAWTGTGDGYTHSAQSTCATQYAGNAPTT